MITPILTKNKAKTVKTILTKTKEKENLEKTFYRQQIQRKNHKA